MDEEPAPRAADERTAGSSDDRVDHQEQPIRPAYYAARSGTWRDWWTLLHPPYTAWFLSYVVIGASLAPRVELSRLLYCLLAFFLAVGLSAHALDELHGRPLRTQIPSVVLVAVASLGVLGALVLGIVGIHQVGWLLLPFMCVGPLVLVAYNLELFGGVLHNDVTFALAWGAFPLLTAYIGETGHLALAPVIGAIGAAALSFAQRSLSTSARFIRRHVTDVDGVLTLSDGEKMKLDKQVLLAPLERTLRSTSWAIILTAAAIAIARLA